MTCEQVSNLVTDYLEGRMGLLKRVRFLVHLYRCVVCRRYVHQMKLTVGGLGKLPPEAPPPEVLSNLQKRFRDWKAKG